MKPRPGVWVAVGLVAFAHFLVHIGLGLTRWTPDLLTVAVLLGARELRMGWGAALGLSLGLLEDAFSLLSFGANAFSLAVVGAIGSRTRDLFVGDSHLFVLSYLAMGKWFRDFLHWVAEGDGVRDPAVQALLLDAVPAALYVSLVGGLVFLVSGAWRESNR